MTRAYHYQRVSWRVTRTADNLWKPVVLIGENPMSMAPVATKREARKLARARAAELDYSSRQH